MISTELTPEVRPEGSCEGSMLSVPAKIQPHHQDRLAVVYVRQSTPQQVLGVGASRIDGLAVQPPASKKGQIP